MSLLVDFAKQQTIKMSKQQYEWFQDVQELLRKDIVRVVLSRQQREILKEIATKLGQSESETMRAAFMEYANSLSVITEKVHGKPTRQQLVRA